MSWQTPFIPDDIRECEGALCFKVDSEDIDAWFPSAANYYGDDARARHAIETCNRCPVRFACLDVAMRTEVNERDGSPLSESSRWGIWGGLTPGQRAKLAGADHAA